MKTRELETFVWYATHPILGELIMALEPANNYKFGIIYSPRMIRERLTPEQDHKASWLELALGPVGIIPYYLYEEAGCRVQPPLAIRLIALLDAYFPASKIAENSDTKLETYIMRALAQQA